jgi:hypothetical protein
LSFFGAEQTLIAGVTQGLSPQYSENTYWFDHATMSMPMGKLFAEGNQGYVAFTQGSDLFVKSWADVPATAHPPAHGEIEVYDGAGYVELEVVGSFGAVAAGASANLEMRWRVRAMPATAQRAVGDAGLLTAVNELLTE